MTARAATSSAAPEEEVEMMGGAEPRGRRAHREEMGSLPVNESPHGLQEFNWPLHTDRVRPGALALETLAPCLL